MNKLKVKAFLRLKKQFIDCTNFPQSTKSPHFPLRGKVGQLSKRNRVLVGLSKLLVYAI